MYESYSMNHTVWCFLTLTRPVDLPRQAPVAQKSADQRRLIANSEKNSRPLHLGHFEKPVYPQFSAQPVTKGLANRNRLS